MLQVYKYFKKNTNLFDSFAFSFENDKMIQRKQTIYLILALLVIIAIGFLMPNPFPVDIDPASPFLIENLGTYLNIPLAIISLVAIFSYGNRKKQILLCNINLVFSLAIFLSLGTLVICDLDDFPIENIYFLFLFPIPLLLVFIARQAIIADEKLVRSVDRIR